ncbi:MAG: DUF4199 domain-containing protein [Alistipes sp.]|nr:DUF4199 domain-containing protein [Alistipes sp.]
MEKTFWSDAARGGAYVGLLLAASSVVETGLVLSGKLGLYVLLLVEWLAVVALHFYLLYRFARRRSALYGAADGFTFGQGYGYVISMSLPAGLILGVANYIFLHLVLGYGNYVEKISDIVVRFSSMGGGMNAPVKTLVEQLRNTPEPSLFSTILGGVWSSVLFAAFFGLIVAGLLARSPQPFADNDNE